LCQRGRGSEREYVTLLKVHIGKYEANIRLP
jgi:hypothetical protein